MKKIKFLTVFAVITGLLLMHSCSEEFLEITPNASLNQTVLGTYDGLDALLVGAYSLLDGVTDNFGWESATSGWVYGSIRGLEANKGTDSGDQPDINPLQTYSETSTNPYLNIKWRATYEGISRANSTILTANIALENGTVTQDEYDYFVNQAKALRGVYHFWAWKLWADRGSNTFVPYVDEETDPKTVVNTEDIRASIISDIEAGTTLDQDMKHIGRFNKTVCQVFLAKAYMNMYEDYSAALNLLSEVESSGKQPAGGDIGLAPHYGDIFDAANRNDIEAIYTVQYSVNDNSGGRNGGWGEVLNFPYKSGASPGGCCGFFNPTQDFVNSFRTGADGLPLIDLAAGTYSYNDEKVTNDQGVALDADYTTYAGNLDPRLDWSVGRRGIPYWDWGPHTGQDWIRDQTYSGPYSPKKQVYKLSQEGSLTEVGNWTSGYTANGYRMIRFADVVLLIAECKAKTGTGDLGLAEVNAIRARAADPTTWVLNDDGTPAAAYVISEYGSFGSAAEAMMAIKFERKLELGQEGHRYYDLQRWGDVVTAGNRILNYEKTMEWGQNLYGGATIGPEDVNFPVPQRQIDVSNGILVQNR
ncbi:MAG: RagB/SusD family nutrient uptake outer membrane protein [Bacteroidetes bacterium]|nr:MAG: RagB/SusD family nutrient uptake outer membrane protein [Bacteroidota bacterium]